MVRQRSGSDISVGLIIAGSPKFAHDLKMTCDLTGFEIDLEIKFPAPFSLNTNPR